MPTLAERFAEVRRRQALVDFYTSADPKSHHCTCRLCDWTWRYGEKELHEPTPFASEVNT